MSDENGDYFSCLLTWWAIEWILRFQLVFDCLPIDLPITTFVGRKMTKTTFQTSRPSPSLKGIAIWAVVFGALTVVSGGSVLFGPDAAQNAAGQFVPFVVWFNFVVGWIYIAAGLAIWTRHRWAFGLSAGIAAATALAAAVFAIWVAQGGAYEMRTVGALALRIGVWLAFAIVVFRAGRQ